MIQQMVSREVETTIKVFVSSSPSQPYALWKFIQSVWCIFWEKAENKKVKASLKHNWGYNKHHQVKYNISVSWVVQNGAPIYLNEVCWNRYENGLGWNILMDN